MTETITFEDIDDTMFVVHFAGPPDDRQLAVYLRELDRRINALERFCFVMDIAPVATLTPAQRKQQAEWVARNFELLQARCWGAAFVIPGTVSRLVFTGITLMQRLPYPFKVVRTREEAQAWLDQQRAAGRA